MPREVMLRTCNPDGTSYGGFRWPEVGGEAIAPDWDSAPVCGGGLHGLARGEGDVALLSWSSDSLWIAAEYDVDEAIDLGGKIKVPRAVVVARGSQQDVTAYVVSRCPGALVVGATLTGGVGATLTGGVGATLTGGNYATLTGGNYATLTGGDRATLTGGVGATLTGGVGATLTGGNGATLTGGDRATVTGGDRATVTGGVGATVTGGNYATLVLSYHDVNCRRRLAIEYVGENDIAADVAYVVRDGIMSKKGT